MRCFNLQRDACSAPTLHDGNDKSLPHGFNLQRDACSAPTRMTQPVGTEEYRFNLQRDACSAPTGILGTNCIGELVFQSPARCLLCPNRDTRYQLHRGACVSISSEMPALPQRNPALNPVPILNAF